MIKLLIEKNLTDYWKHIIVQTEISYPLLLEQFVPDGILFTSGVLLGDAVHYTVGRSDVGWTSLLSDVQRTCIQSMGCIETYHIHYDMYYEQPWCVKSDLCCGVTYLCYLGGDNS